MTIRVAINGYGRIGQSVLRAWFESGLDEQIEIVAINELADADTIAYLTRYDSAHGRFPQQVDVRDSQTKKESNQSQTLLIGDKEIQLIHQPEPTLCPWAELQIDLVMECTGVIKTRDQAQAHLIAGAKKVLISHPADSSVDATILFGFNEGDISGSESIVSCGSCSTNALIPILKVMDEELGIERGVTTTIHSAMNDQPVIDTYHSDLRRTRAANQSIIPVDTALPKGIERVLPELAGKIESLHVRVPTLNVSVLDVSLSVEKDTSIQQVNELLQAAATKQFKGTLAVTNEPHASIDFNHDPRSAIVDCTQTKVSDGRLIKLFIWFDNEWGFSNRMLDTAKVLFK